MAPHRRRTLSLPQDIVYNITSSLSDDYLTLRNCCTVSRLFLAPSRKELYSTIHLRRSDEDSARILYETFAIHPEFFYHVRAFHVIGLGWGTDEADFLYLLRSTTKLGLLRTFTLDTQYSNGTWEALPAPTRMALLDLFLTSPKLYTIRLTNLCGETFPVQVFGSVPELRDLGFVGYHSQRDCPHTRQWDAPAQEIVFPPPSAKEIHLDVLEISQLNAAKVVDYTSDPECPIKLSRLRELRIHKAGHDLLKSAWEVMKLSAHSLESFTWRDVDDDFATTDDPIPSEPYTPYSPFDLTLLTSLKTLALYKSATRTGTMLNVLKRCGVPPNLVRLVLVYPDAVSIPQDEAFEEEMKVQLGSEDTLFASLKDMGALTQLRSLELLIVTSRPKYAAHEYLESRLQEWMPSLSTSEMGMVRTVGYADVRRMVGVSVA